MQGQATIGQGQQPILNDALSYLDQVKVRFSEQPDVYNRFLDIMKDFKSQAIDTPGVIDRVSNLFNGHPSLIQGFNTFLPPGYRIECGTDDNPDAIRVTTPSGTMTQSLQPRQRQFEGSSLNPVNSAFSRQPGFEAGRPAWQGGQQSANTISQFSPSNRAVGLPPHGLAHAGATGESSFDHENTDAALVHQQEQRGVSHLQNAVSAATNGVTARQPIIQSSPGQSQPAILAQAAALGIPGQPGDPKRGPVEFNHAISYVNKIKNRFAQQPEIYKQFLEILQTYQRESKPIGDVYAQVTTLFDTAPDLLEDFKQFLPESAAHAKAQAQAAAQRAIAEQPQTSSMRDDPTYGTGSLAQAQTPRAAAKMPPMGQFDPPSTSKDNKKRRGGPSSQNTLQSGQQQSSLTDLTAGSRQGQLGNANKRAKLNHARPVQPEAPEMSPTLVPQLPAPLPPTFSGSATSEEMLFFDRVKKHIANRASYAEFMKLLNLFTQDIIDKPTLVSRAESFIGNNTDLMRWFEDWVHARRGEQIIIEMRPAHDPGRVNLAHCQAFGPSYRSLPKRDQDKRCSGRDEMCYEVLNDQWASHPTWASEDSGFIAHRKNQYEDGLHRLEEERHDYDFHIESCHRTIQLMEPIVRSFLSMTEAERSSFQVSPALGGQSEAIPKRVIMYVYGRDKGAAVLQSMVERPTQVLPMLLKRLKQKYEEWRMTQREWDKVWREQMCKFYWRSLDHQGINAKNSDKKNFQQKTLTSEIQAKYEENKRDRDAGHRRKKYQMACGFKDKEVIYDAGRLVLVALEREASIYNGGEQERIAAFLKDFVPLFFGLDRDDFIERMADIPSKDEEDEANSDDINAAKARPPNVKKTDFLRRFGNGKDSSAVSESKESTPAATAPSEDMPDAPDASETTSSENKDRALFTPSEDQAKPKALALDEVHKRSDYNLYCNGTIYCFFRLFEMLYSRLVAVKQNEKKVHTAVSQFGKSNARPKAAIILNMIDKLPGDLFADTGPDANYYSQVLQMCEDVVSGATEMNHLEEVLRRFYLQSGWHLYTIDKLLSSITRFIMNILSSDSKDKSVDMTNLFFKDRERAETTRTQEMQYRKHVQRLVKDGEIYRINYVCGDLVLTDFN